MYLAFSMVLIDLGSNVGWDLGEDDPPPPPSPPQITLTPRVNGFSFFGRSFHLFSGFPCLFFVYFGFFLV